MLENNLNFQATGGSSMFPVEQLRPHGYPKVVVGTTIPSYGTVVAASVDNASEFVDTSKIDGPASPMTCVELRAAAPAFPTTHPYGITTDVEAKAAGEDVTVATRNCIVWARVWVPDGGLQALHPLEPNFTAAQTGTLKVYTGAAKCIAMTAVAVADHGVEAGQEQLVPVHMDCQRGFGA